MSVYIPTNRQILLGTYSDAYKEIHGFRPSLSSFSDMTETEIQSSIDQMTSESINSEDKEISIFMSYGAPDRSTALTWMGQVYEGYL